MNSLNSLSSGFADPVHDAQHAFRQVLQALSRPGRPLAIGQAIEGLALGPAMAHVLLALTDDDTPVWWQQADSAAAHWLRFHTGAPVAAASAQAAFAVLTRPGYMPPLASFSTGSAEAPEASATLIMELPALDGGPAVEWRGPGMREAHTVCLAGLPENFWTQWQANQALFPQGVDMVFTCASRALGLPRTTRVRRLEGV